ncbi:alpha-amylase family glycosyl hydrolase [Balneola sp. MJW-20]|uniref:alpha-amylase family glycosyl hydrolase n=1 Tax=Gracilimonas aurantiaca TaxID=3234185 RepID=UPI0034660E74
MNFSKYSLAVLVLIATLTFTACEAPAPQSSSVVPPQSKVEQLDWTKNASIYEINVRQFSEEGTFNAVREELPRLKEMGIRILWLMPVHPIGEINRKGSLGSYYSVADYKDVNPNFGTKEDFRALVDEAHEMGFKVIIDWVANHTAWDNPWTANPDWYELNEQGEFIPPRGTDWTDVIQLDYTNENMRAAMIEALEYWVRDMDIDGYRCDVAGMVPTDFWVEAIDSLNQIKPVFMLAEDGEPELVVEAFQMNYAWAYAHMIREVAKGDSTFTDLTELINDNEKRFPRSAYRMYFTSNHDENSWTGSDSAMYGDNFENFAVLSATISGMPLIYNGQETGLNEQLEFFEKDPIQWDGYEYQNLYTTLLKLKRDEEALWNGAYGAEPEFIKMPEGMFAYSRAKGESEVIVALNFNSENGMNQVALADLGVDESYTTYNSESILVTSDSVSLSPNEWVIFVK